MNKNTQEIINFAVENEIEAFKFYSDVAKKVEDKNLKETFEDLAREEEKHKVYLKDFLEGKLSEMNIEDVADYGIAESVDEPKLSTEMAFSDAIALAMKKEQSAKEMYEKLANIADTEEQKNLFEELAKMEKMHKVRLEDIYNNAAFVEVW